MKANNLLTSHSGIQLVNYYFNENIMKISDGNLIIYDIKCRSYLVTRSQNVRRCFIRNTEVDNVRGSAPDFEDFASLLPPITSNFEFLFGSSNSLVLRLAIFSFNFSIKGHYRFKINKYIKYCCYGEIMISC